MNDLSSSDNRVRAARVRLLAQGLGGRAAEDLISLAIDLEAQAAEEESQSRPSTSEE